MRWPVCRLRNRLPSSAPGRRAMGVRSGSPSTPPVLVAGSYDWTTPCTVAQAFATLPALRQDVQARMRRELLPSFTRMRWMWGSQRRLLRLWEWLTCFPTHGPLPQISHTNDTGGILFGNGRGGYQPGLGVAERRR